MPTCLQLSCLVLPTGCVCRAPFYAGYDAPTAMDKRRFASGGGNRCVGACQLGSGYGTLFRPPTPRTQAALLLRITVLCGVQVGCELRPLQGQRQTHWWSLLGRRAYSRGWLELLARSRLMLPQPARSVCCDLNEASVASDYCLRSQRAQHGRSMLERVFANKFVFCYLDRAVEAVEFYFAVPSIISSLKIEDITTAHGAHHELIKYMVQRWSGSSWVTVATHSHSAGTNVKSLQGLETGIKSTAMLARSWRIYFP